MKLRRVEFLLIICISLASIFSAMAAEFQQVQIKGPKDATAQYSGVTYGPIDSNDTLWRIADSYRQNKSLSLYQVMVGIYELNPDAFEDNNLNLLKDGSILRLPSERYISRIDSRLARQKAEQDEANWQPGGEGAAGSSTSNLKPASKPISKDDLTQSTQELEKKLGALDEEQTRQFKAIRQQFADSIDNIQSLLNDNQQIYANLDSVNQQIEALQQQEGDNQLQTKQILDIQNEILAMFQQQQMQEQAAKLKSEKKWISNELLAIGGSALFSIAILMGFAFWLMKRNRKAPAEAAQGSEFTAPLMEQTTEIDDLSEALANELSDELDDELSDDGLFGEEDLLDDVLSDELGESLDEALDQELDDFDDLNEEMLVPDSSDSSDSSNSSDSEETEELDQNDGELDQDELDSLFEEDDDLLAELDEEMDAIELSEDDDEEPAELAETAEQAEQEQAPEPVAEAEPKAATDSQLQPDLIAEKSSESLVAVEDEQEKPEISIDELLTEREPAILDSINVDDSENISEEMLQQLDKEIVSQSNELDKATDELLNELEQIEMMQGMLPDDDDDDEAEAEEPLSDEPQHSIQQLDQVSDDLVDELDDSQVDEELNDQLLAEMGVTDAPEEELDSAEMADSVEESLIDDSLPEDTESDDDTEAADSADEQQEIAPTDIEAADIVDESVQPEQQVPDTDEEQSANEIAQDELVEQLLSEQPEEQVPDTDEEESVDEVAQDELVEQPLSEQPEEQVPDTDEEESVDEIAPETEAELQQAAEPDLVVESTDEFAPADTGIDATESDEVSTDDSEDLAIEPMDELDQALEEFEKGDSEFDIELEEDELTSDASSAADIMPAEGAEELTDDELDQLQDDSELDSADPFDDEFPQIDELAQSPVDKDMAEKAGSSDMVSEETDDVMPSLDDIDSLADFDDSELEQALDSFEQEELDDEIEHQAKPQPINKSSEELDDVPGLGDWLSGSDAEENSDLDDLENTSFDELLDSIAEPTSDDNDEAINLLDNSDLDIDALLSEDESAQDAELTIEDLEADEDFLDVETLLNESVDAESTPLQDKDIELNVSLDDIPGLADDADLIDVDGDNGVGAKMDLARAYIEIEDIDSAKELLSEVIESGEAEQQKEAQEILDSL